MRVLKKPITRRVSALLLLAFLVAISLGSKVNARFISPDDWDPNLQGVGTNRYSYAENDPINRSDQNGHMGALAGDGSQTADGPEALMNMLDAALQAAEVVSEGLNGAGNPEFGPAAKGLRMLGYEARALSKAMRMARLDRVESQVGRWVSTNERMSASAAAHQMAVTGRPVRQSFMVKGVKFDGYDKFSGTLLEAKANFRGFVGPDGRFRGWFRGQYALADQARRQLTAAGKRKIRWVFSDERSANATKKLFEREKIRGISIEVNNFKENSIPTSGDNAVKQ